MEREYLTYFDFSFLNEVDIINWLAFFVDDIVKDWLLDKLKALNNLFFFFF